MFDTWEWKGVSWLGECVIELIKSKAAGWLTTDRGDGLEERAQLTASAMESEMEIIVNIATKCHICGAGLMCSSGAKTMGAVE